MAAIRDLGRRGPSSIILDPNIIFENPTDNTRNMESEDTINHVREMANAIISGGNEAFPPITVYQDGDIVYVSAGWCRRRAHVLAMSEGAPIAGIMCMSAPRKKPEDLALSILTSNDGLPLTAMEKAKAVVRLQSFLWTPETIADKTGWSVSTVRNLILLHNSPDSITDMVKSGRVSATLATNIVREKGEEAETILKNAVDSAEKIGKKKATHKDIEGAREAKKAGVNWKKFGPKLYTICRGLYEVKEGRQQRLAEIGEILMEIEDTYGAIKE